MNASLRKELNARREEMAREFHNLYDKTPKNKKISRETSQKFDNLTAGITAIEDRLAREKKLRDWEKIQTIQGGSSERVLLNKYMREGEPLRIRNTMSTTTDSQGGHTVKTEVAGSMLNAMKAYGGMREAGTVFQTSQGNPMSWPTSDGTSEIGELVDENYSATDEDPSFGTKALPVYKYSSKVVTVPIELLQDPTVDMEAYIRGRIVTRFVRATNPHLTTGTGSGQPTGVVNAVTVGKTGTSGQTTSIIYDDVVDLEHSVDPAYRISAKCGFMFSDGTLKVIKKLKDEIGRPLWLPGLAGKASSTVLGYRFTINQDMAVPAASAISMLFGDFSKYVIRDVMAITYHRFTDSAYVRKGQVGFLAFMRSGGNYMDVGGAIKSFQHPAN